MKQVRPTTLPRPPGSNQAPIASSTLPSNGVWIIREAKREEGGRKCLAKGSEKSRSCSRTPFSIARANATASADLLDSCALSRPPNK